MKLIRLKVTVASRAREMGVFADVVQLSETGPLGWRGNLQNINSIATPPFARFLFLSLALKFPYPYIPS
jgi:hypothetical protein